MIDFHRRMLQDTVRNRAFAQALKRVVVPEKSIVADIGAGTGFLAFLASRLGAKECILYEYADVMRVAQALAKENGIRNVRFVHGHSADERHPVRADVVVSETLGNFAFEERILETMDDARRRHLKSGGVMIPGSITQVACPVIADRMRREIGAWDVFEFKLHVDAAQEMAFHNIYVRTIPCTELLGGGKDARELETVDFSRKNASKRALSVSWDLQHRVSCSGFAVWWEALLVPGVTLSTSPLEPSTHWEQIYMPLSAPLLVDCGDRLILDVTIDTRPSSAFNITWRAAVHRGGKEIAVSPRFDMRKGYLS